MEVKEIPSFSEAQVRWIKIPKKTQKKVGKQGGMVSTTISAFIWKLSLSQPDLPITGGRRIRNERFSILRRNRREKKKTGIIYLLEAFKRRISICTK